jgi:hypothetical protein
VRDSKATTAFIDPPYNVRIEENVSALGAIHHREFVMASGEMSEAKFTEFLRRAFVQRPRKNRAERHSSSVVRAATTSVALCLQPVITPR